MWYEAQLLQVSGLNVPRPDGTAVCLGYLGTISPAPKTLLRIEFEKPQWACCLGGGAPGVENEQLPAIRYAQIGLERRLEFGKVEPYRD